MAGLVMAGSQYPLTLQMLGESLEAGAQPHSERDFDLRGSAGREMG